MRERWQALAFIVAWIVSLAAVWTAASAMIPRPPAVGGPVEAGLVVRGPDGTITYSASTRNATVFGLLLEASVVRDFSLTWVDWQWPYEDVFVTSIAGIWNDHGANRWWLYCLNGRYADLGARHQALRAGDMVLWIYAAQEGDAICA